MAVSLLKKYEGGLSFNEIDSYTSKARTWYLNELQSLTINRQRLLKDTETRKRNRLLPGRMFMYFYDPKHKDTLPYYDRFPLVLVLEKAKSGGFLGLNLHYLDYRKRAILLGNLLDFANNKKFDESTRLNMSYQMLKTSSKHRAFKPCLKQYLPKHFRSDLREVPAEYWETVLFFPSEQFKKASKSKVFSDSRAML
jgi:hypothetical protein